MKHRISAGALVKRGDQILLVRHMKQGSYDFWVPPGGGVFPDGGGKPQKQPIPESVMEKAQEIHNQLVEAAAENEEGLMEKFFEEGNLNEADLAKGLTIALANQSIYPVFCCSETCRR